MFTLLFDQTTLFVIPRFPLEATMNNDVRQSYSVARLIELSVERGGSAEVSCLPTVPSLRH